MRALGVLLALGAVLIGLLATGNLPIVEGGSADAQRSVAGDFSGRSAYASVRRQVRIGPRPAGSAASRRLASRLRRALPRGRFQPVPGGLRNVVGEVRGRDPRRTVIVGAHYDTKDLPGFVGANDGAAGTAVAVELARALRRHRPRSNVLILLFDGEEAPRGVPDSRFAQRGLRGSKVAAAAYGRRARAMILLDFVGQRGLRLRREGSSDRRLWARLRRAAARVGRSTTFPRGDQPGTVLDDHTPFLARGVPSIDLIDFDYPCFHRRCDDLSRISAHSLDATGETVLRLLRTL